MLKKESMWKSVFAPLPALLISLIVGLLMGGGLVGIFFSVSSRPKLLVAFSAFLGTFIASVMAEDQDVRLRNGTFGALAGASVGGFAALLVDDKSLLLVGIFGSSCGAILGWIVYLCLSFLAATTVGRPLLEYQFGGLRAVREKLDVDDREKLGQALAVWSQNFSRVVTYEKVFLLNRGCQSDTNELLKIAIKNWLIIITDVLNLVLATLAKKAELRSRVTIIIFESAKGLHWISYAGNLPAHSRKPFDNKSVAYKVLQGQLSSPHLATIAIANSGSQNRTPEGQGDNKKSGAEAYSQFYSFRLSNSAILSIDWPGELETDDPLIDVFKNLFYLDIAPAVGELLSHWCGKIEDEPELKQGFAQN
jgi:hypothetical protein